MNLREVAMGVILLINFHVIAATSDGVTLLPIQIDLRDKASLQRGAKIFMNYCSGCHSLQYMRYNRLAQGLGLTTFTGEIDKDLLFNNLVFTQAKIHDPIRISLSKTDARQWFGVVPPDLSLSARFRGPSWLYTYLKTFYVDETRPFGTNNILIPQVAMPNVLEPLAGKVIPVRKVGKEGELFISYLQQISPGEMTEQEFDNILQDLVTFLTFVAEPSKLTRYRIGYFVLGFLIVFFIVAYSLKKVYWKKI